MSLMGWPDLLVVWDCRFPCLTTGGNVSSMMGREAEKRVGVG